jgi:Uncharacterized conserved protein
MYLNYNNNWDRESNVTPSMQMQYTDMSMPPCMMIPNQGMQPQASPALVDETPYIYPQNLPEALMLIKNAVAGEREDEMFYDWLISTAPSNEDKQIITSIRDDERKHNKMFRQIYFELTGQMLSQSTETNFEKPVSYIAGLQKALFGELGAVERYRRILFAMQSRKHINMITEIMSDELKHASKYNFLYAKNKK